MGTHTKRPTSAASNTLEMARNRFYLLLDKAGVHYDEGDIPTLLPPEIRVAFLDFMNAREQLRRLRFGGTKPKNPLAKLAIPSMELDELATAK